jgi:tetratricopeptide (TPR) repeat protein
VNTRVKAAALAVALLSACGPAQPPGDQRTGDMTADGIQQARANWSAELSALIDSGNAAYSAQDYESAASLYRRAAALEPDVTAAWFGIYMAEHARGNILAADSAMARAQQLSPEASIIHATPADTGPPGGAPHP